MSLNIRLNKIVKYSGKNVTAFGKDFSSTTSENIRKLIKKENANPTFNFIVELLQKYPEVNYKWLLFNEGDMLNTIKYNNDNQLDSANDKPTSPYTDPCTNPECIKNANEKERIIKDLRLTNDLLLDKIKQKGESPPGKHVEGGVDEPNKTGTDG